MKLIAKVTDVFGNVSYLSVEDGRASYALANGIPYSMTGIAPKDAMALKFDCEACETVEQLVATIRRHQGTPTPGNERDKRNVEAHSPKPAAEIVAVVDVSAAFDVADYLNRTIPTACPAGSVKAWEEVRDALYALANDTDAIVTREV